MRRQLFVLLFVTLAALSSLAQTSASNQIPVRSIPGSLDPKTSLFTPSSPVVAPEANAAAATIFGGNLVFNFTITVTSTLPTTDTISCSANADVVDAGTGVVIIEQATAKATRSGATATCAVTIPYSWSLATASTDRMSLTYVINGAGTTTATALPFRLSSQGLGSFAIPANGITSTFTVKSTI